MYEPPRVIIKRRISHFSDTERQQPSSSLPHTLIRHSSSPNVYVNGIIYTAIEVIDCSSVGVWMWRVGRALQEGKQDALYLIVNGLVPRRVCQPDAIGSHWNVLYMSSYARLRDGEEKREKLRCENKRTVYGQNSHRQECAIIKTKTWWAREISGIAGTRARRGGDEGDIWPQRPFFLQYLLCKTISYITDDISIKKITYVTVIFF